MRNYFVVALPCLLLAGCAEYDFSPMSSMAPQATEVQQLDNASTSKLYLSVVDGLIAQGRYRAALAYLDQYAVQEKPTPRFHELHGEALLGTEQYEAAAAAFERLQRTEKKAEGLSGLGRVAAAEGDWARAASFFQKAVATRPASPEFLNNLGYAQLMSGDEDMLRAAEFNLRQAQELDPSSISIRNNLLIALVMTGKKQDANKLLSSISTAHERAEVQDFAMSWVQAHQPTSSLPTSSVKERDTQ